MSAEQQIEQAVRNAKLKMASRMLRAAEFVQKHHMAAVSKPVVKVGKVVVERSKPGEYPRLETGEGKKGVVYGPDTAEGIIQAGMVVRIGQTMASKHMLHLEFGRYMVLGVWIKFMRLGWRQTARDTLALVRALITGRG